MAEQMSKNALRVQRQIDTNSGGMSKNTISKLRAQREEERIMEAEKAAGAPDPDKPYNLPVQKKAKGGYVRSADGIAKRGKTKGRMI